MIKLVFCMRRLSTLSSEGFHEYWRNHHAPLVRSVAPLLRIRRYVQCESFTDARIAPAVEARAAQVHPYDGVAELWWDNIDDILAAGSTSECRAAGRKLLEDERRFIDLGDSSLFYVRENVVIGESMPV
jgi:uncharacterized protein (TIGR02118 family)